MTYLFLSLAIIGLGALSAPLALRYYKRSRRKNKKVTSRTNHEAYDQNDDRYLASTQEDVPNPLFAPPIVEDNVEEMEEELFSPSSKSRPAFLKREETPPKELYKEKEEEPVPSKQPPPELNRMAAIKRESHASPKKKAHGELRQSELIIPIYIVARREFEGSDIFPVLGELGLRYGEMKIFHHYGMGEIKIKKPIFSLANMMEPGTFDPDSTEEFSTPGLVLFMRLPGPFGGRVAFELMLNTGQKIAEILEGNLEDEHHRSLTQQVIQTLRERIAHFEQRDTPVSLLKRFS